MQCVDIGENFQTHIYLQNLAPIQPRTSPVKFAASRDVLHRPVRSSRSPGCETWPAARQRQKPAQKSRVEDESSFDRNGDEMLPGVAEDLRLKHPGC